jgi:CheY-like chemotaxis protein
MPDGGTLTIATQEVTLKAGSLRGAESPSPAGPYIVLSVRDTGCGMSPQIMKRIFEPFFTTKEPGKGTGLGLATVRAAVEKSGGYLDVESEVGKGSCFRIYFPRTGSPAEVQTALMPAPAMSSRPTILVAEDHPEVRQVIREVLTTAGYRVFAAGRPSEALTLSDQIDWAIDLLISDGVMPELSGPSLARILAQRRPGLKVLFISGYTDEKALENITEESNLFFLPKPFDNDTLINKVSSILR